MRTVGRILQATAGVMFLATATVRADKPTGEPVMIDADKVSFDQPSHMAYGDGNAVILYHGTTLRADHIRLNSETRDAWAEGNVRLNRHTEEWVVPAAHINFDTQKFEATQIRGFFDPVIISADAVRSVTTNYYVYTRGKLTTCDYEQPHYSWQATRGEIWPNDRIVMYNCTLRFGDIPVFWLPMMTWSLKDEYPPLLLSVGRTSRWGYYVLSGTYWHLTDSATLTAHVDWREKRGFGLGVDIGYNLGDSGGGRLRDYYIDDHNPVTDINPAGGPDINRYRVQWQHKQALTDNLDFTADINRLSDDKMIRDFFPREFSLDREPDNVINLTSRSDNFTVSALVRPPINNFFAEVERLPELKLAINRTRLGSTPLYYEGEASMGYFRNDPGDTGDPAFVGQAFRSDNFHQIVMPQMLFGWLSVVPHAGIRGTWYSVAPDTAPKSNEVGRVVYDAGVETSFKLSRTWDDIQSTRWHIDGLRHIIEPFSNYQWVPTPNVRPGDLFQFDTLRTVTFIGGDSLSVTRYAPLDFPAYNSIDSIDAENILRFGIRQRLQTRRDDRPWDLIELTGWTDWRIERQPGQPEFSDLFGMLRLQPAEWIAQKVDARYDFRDSILRELNSTLSVLDGERWRIDVATRYLRDDSNTVGMNLFYRVGRHWALHTAHRVDIEDGFLEFQQYGITQETHDWIIDYGVYLRGQRTKHDDLSVFVAATLKAYPGFKLLSTHLDVSREINQLSQPTH